MKSFLPTLLQLSEVDSNLTKLSEAKQKFPLIIKEIESQLQKLSNELASFPKDLDVLQNKKKEQDQLIHEKNEWIQKRETQINEIKTTREYQASVKEIAVAKKEIIDRTAQIELLNQQMTDLQKKWDDTKATCQPKISELEQKLAECHNRLSSIDPKIAEQQMARDSWLSKLDDAARNLYLSTQKKVTPALSSAQNKICAECGNRIPPQIFNQLFAETELQFCPACKRILHLEDAAAS